MKKFYYSAKNESGEIVKDFIEANDSNEAELFLIDKGYEIIELKEASVFDEIEKNLTTIKEKLTSVTLKDLIVFTRQFATLFSAGIPIVTILERLKEHVLNSKLKRALNEIAKDIDAGSSLYVAFNKHSDIFPSFYIGMIRVGEEGGVLDQILKRVAAILETQLLTENRIKSATRYPKFVIIAITFAFIVLLTFVIPKFVAIFQKFNTQLPLPTRILIWVNYAFKRYWWIVVIIISVSILLFKRYRSTPEGKLKIDDMMLKLPVVGELMKKIYLSRIARILGLLYQSGIPINTSFDIVADVTGNERFKIELKNIRNMIETGTNINSAIRSSPIFPPIVADMVESGEETGQLDEMLFKVADYFDEETDYAIQNLSSAIEPILLIFIAAMILVIALGVFLPMWDMIKVFKS